jgi:cytochrome P450
MAGEAVDKDQDMTRPVSDSGAGPSTARDQALPAAQGVLDLGDPNFMSSAYATYADLRGKGDVVRVSVPPLEAAEDDEDSEAQNAFREFFGRDVFFVTRYNEGNSALVDERFSVDPLSKMTPEERAKQPPTPEEFRPFSRSLLAVDPPDHTRLRKLVQPSFSAQAMEALRPRIQRIAEDLLDKAEREAAERGKRAPDRQVDLIEAFAYPMPVTVISDMVGIPLEDRVMVRGWTEQLLTNRRGRGFDKETRAKLREFTAYLRELFARRRRDPTDDLISQLVHAQEDGERLDDDELLSMVFIVYIAGHVTTVNLIGNGVVALLTHPDQLARLKADPSLAKGVVEETLRYWGPVDTIVRRIAKEDVDIGSTRIPKGEHMMVGLASASYDPTRFTNPEDFDITRADANRHMAFGKGIHLCLGAPLARIEGQIAFETLVRRLPDLRLAVPAEEVRWSGSFLRGFSKIPLLF